MKPLPIPFSKKPDKVPRVSSLYMKLRSRFTIYFFLLVLLPFLLFTIAAYLYTRSLSEKSAFDLAVTAMEQERAAIEKYVDELKIAAGAAADSIPDRPGVSGASATSSVSSASAAAAENRLKYAIEGNMGIVQLKSLSAAYIINEDGILASYGSDAEKAAINSPSSQYWFHRSVMEPESVHMLGTIQRFYAGGSSKTVLSMAKGIPAASGQAVQDVLLFDFSYRLLSDFTGVETTIWKLTPEHLIIDFEGNILYSPSQGKLTTKLDESLTNLMGSAEKGFEQVHYGGRSCYMSYVRYPSLGWIFLDLNPASNVTEGLWVKSPVMVVLIILLPVILIVYFALVSRLMNPINKLTTVISDYESQLPGVSTQTPLLGNTLPASAMGGISDIDLLINKIYSIKLRQKEAELNSLQNQINPHFLYNTLESIRGAALYHGIHEIAAMSKALSLLFRYSISDKVLVSIKEELQHLDNYMSIQNFRYENKFELVYSVSPKLMDYKILKLTLQPLIENSIKHGLEMKLGKGTIKVEILEMENNIKILISDDGLGIPSKKIEELNRAIAYDKYLSGSEPDRSGTGIGVKNVNSRIKLYFGDQYGLKFREALAGTTVEITLPAVMDN